MEKETQESTPIPDALVKCQENIVTNFVLKSKRPISLERTKIEGELFEKIAAMYPGMTNTSYPKEGQAEGDDENEEEAYAIRENDVIEAKRQKRALRMSHDDVAIAAAHPLEAVEQDRTCRALVQVVEESKLIQSPLQLAYADFKWVFELKFSGNHHQAILESLFGTSAFGELVRKTGGRATAFNPEVLMLHREDRSTRLYVEVRPRTSIQEILSNKYDGDQIAAICSAVKVTDFRPDQTMTGLYDYLKQELIRLVLSPYLASIVEPLSAAARRHDGA